MQKEFCYLLLLILTAHYNSLNLKTRSQVATNLEEYGRKEEGSSISLKYTPKDENHSLSLLSEYQDYMGNYDKCMLVLTFSYNWRQQRG
jgi:hypothetical protein